MNRPLFVIASHRALSAIWAIWATYAVFAGCDAAVQAQGYPAKPIRLVVPLAAGGGNDTLARYVGKYLTESLGQAVVVENRAGGGGLAGGEYVARSAPDGYTLVVAGSGLIVVTLTNKQFNFQRDLAPIALMGEYATLLVCHPSMPAGNVRELKNAVERAVIMSRGTMIGQADIIPRHLRNGGGMPDALTIPVGATAAEARPQLGVRPFASPARGGTRTPGGAGGPAWPSYARPDGTWRIRWSGMAWTWVAWAWFMLTRSGTVSGTWEPL